MAHLLIVRQLYKFFFSTQPVGGRPMVLEMWGTVSQWMWKSPEVWLLGCQMQARAQAGDITAIELNASPVHGPSHTHAHRSWKAHSASASILPIGLYIVCLTKTRIIDHLCVFFYCSFPWLSVILSCFFAYLVNFYGIVDIKKKKSQWLPVMLSSTKENFFSFS